MTNSDGDGGVRPDTGTDTTTGTGIGAGTGADPAGEEASTFPPRRFGWSDMFLPREEDPRTDGGFRGERDVIVGYLEDQRRTLVMKCADLTPEQLSRRAVEPSNLSLLGLVRHMADVERGWFRRVMADEDAPPLWRRRPDGEDPDGDFNGAVADPAVVAEAWERWEEEVAFARRLVADAPDLGVIGTGRGNSVELREVLVHMIEEYARHNGHADFLRERIDGRVGQ